MKSTFEKKKNGEEYLKGDNAFKREIIIQLKKEKKTRY